MIEGEMLKLSVEEFSRLQDYMIETDKNSTAYKKMDEEKIYRIESYSYRFRS